jgi:hypothetical protein
VLPRSICLVCLTLMWLEAVLGLCLGCELYGFLARRGLIGRLHGFDVCVGGACAVPDRPGPRGEGDGSDSAPRRASSRIG